ncbi:PREDICTED: arginine [Prunus dulcis]|uniref:Protein arginine N-methyltransferase n=1 Tax=Prunus dulcis TaxID=3755 RepID=A0A5E4G4E0_PRUDU|nr:protein arginine N-methyltransferase 1.6 isoform X1 [Prunus dulcis]VVA34540.1 PREDICTED: arginine [Prunus dulcis]
MLSRVSKTLFPKLPLCSILRFARAMSSQSAQRAFQLRVNPITGNSEWVVIEEDEPEEQTFNGGSQNALLATTSYLDMLNDSQRNRAFREAIDKTISTPCHVLDIGSGTGLLSMMAARAMGSMTCRMVTACESYLPMVKLMKKVVRLNGMENQIKLINKRSDELKRGIDITSPAQVLVSEILDSELLGEGLIPSLQHAHDMLLVENPETVPYKATTYGQLVESTFLWKLHDLHGNEAKASDGIRLVPTGLDNILGVKPQQYAFHCDAIGKEVKLLSEPFKIFEFDFWKRPDSHGETEVHVKATNDGRVHAVISWWILQLDREGTIFYSTAPRWISLPGNTSHGDWCDHWKQCVWFVPGEGMSITKDEEVCLHAVHTDISISYNLKKQASRNEIMQYGFKNGDFKLTLPPERIAIYGDSEWRHTMFSAISNSLQGRVDPLCIVADDSIFLTLLVAHLSKTSHVMSFFPGLQDKGFQYLQAVANSNGFSMDRVEFLNKRKTKLTMHDTHQKKVDLLIGEPFYYGMDGMLPWQNLRFWNERTMLDSVLSQDALILPCKAILKTCALSAPDLWNSRCCLSKIEGFDHSVVNSTLGACGESPAEQECPCLPYFIWQCGNVKKLSEAFTVMEFDCSKPITSSCGKTQVEFTEPGICHGFALWIDWVMDSENSLVVSTGPEKRYWKQGVKLLAEPVAVRTNESRSTGECRSAVIQASFDPSSGDLDVRHAFS